MADSDVDAFERWAPGGVYFNDVARSLYGNNFTTNPDYPLLGDSLAGNNFLDLTEQFACQAPGGTGQYSLEETADFLYETGVLPTSYDPALLLTGFSSLPLLLAANRTVFNLSAMSPKIPPVPPPAPQPDNPCLLPLLAPSSTSESTPTLNMSLLLPDTPNWANLSCSGNNFLGRLVSLEISFSLRQNLDGPNGLLSSSAGHMLELRFAGQRTESSVVLHNQDKSDFPAILLSAGLFRVLPSEYPASLLLPVTGLAMGWLEANSNSLPVLDLAAMSHWNGEELSLQARLWPGCTNMAGPAPCGPHGSCDAQSVQCVCHEGWYGSTCQLPSCVGVTVTTLPDTSARVQFASNPAGKAYLPGADCWWLISAQAGQNTGADMRSPELWLSAFALEAGYDILEIYDGWPTSTEANGRPIRLSGNPSDPVTSCSSGPREKKWQFAWLRTIWWERRGCERKHGRCPSAAAGLVAAAAPTAACGGAGGSSCANGGQCRPDGLCECPAGTYGPGCWSRQCLLGQKVTGVEGLLQSGQDPHSKHGNEHNATAWLPQLLDCSWLVSLPSPLPDNCQGCTGFAFRLRAPFYLRPSTIDTLSFYDRDTGTLMRSFTGNDPDSTKCCAANLSCADGETADGQWGGRPGYDAYTGETGNTTCVCGMCARERAILVPRSRVEVRLVTSYREAPSYFALSFRAIELTKLSTQYHFPAWLSYLAMAFALLFLFCSLAAVVVACHYRRWKLFRDTALSFYLLQLLGAAGLSACLISALLPPTPRLCVVRQLVMPGFGVFAVAPIPAQALFWLRHAHSKRLPDRKSVIYARNSFRSLRYFRTNTMAQSPTAAAASEVRVHMPAQTPIELAVSPTPYPPTLTATKKKFDPTTTTNPPRGSEEIPRMDKWTRAMASRAVTRTVLLCVAVQIIFSISFGLAAENHEFMVRVDWEHNEEGFWHLRCSISRAYQLLTILWHLSLSLLGVGLTMHSLWTKTRGPGLGSATYSQVDNMGLTRSLLLASVGNSVLFFPIFVFFAIGQGPQVLAADTFISLMVIPVLLLPIWVPKVFTLRQQARVLRSQRREHAVWRMVGSLRTAIEPVAKVREIVKAVTQCPTAVNWRHTYKDGSTALMEAVKGARAHNAKDDEDFFRQLSQEDGNDPQDDTQDRKRFFDLRLSVSREAKGKLPADVIAAIELVKCLLERGAKPNMVDDYGNTALHHVAKHGHPAVVASLLASEHVNPYRLNDAGLTGAQVAERARNLPVAKLLSQQLQLIKAQAPILDAVMTRQKVSTLRMLIRSKADVNAMLHEANPLLEACRQGHTSVALVLIAAGADVEVVDETGSALLHACMHNDVVLASALIKAGAPMYAASEQGLLPRTVAKELGLDGQALANLLEEYHTIPRVDPNRVRLQNKLGQGDFGIVYAASYLGVVQAVKAI
eukprot:g14173.t1